MKNSIGVNLVKIASVYMLIGLGIGLYVAISKQFVLMTVHSHTSLLGWLTMAVTGLVYMVAPSCAASRLAFWHFLLHNIGLPVMLVSLALYEYGNTRAEAFLGIGSVVVLFSLLLFAVNVCRRLRKD